jgi:hypothetical protein
MITALAQQLCIVTGSKGGTGKSTAAALLADYFRSAVPTALYDGDAGIADNQSLAQHYAVKGADGRALPDQRANTGVVGFDVRKPDERDLIFDILDGGNPRAVVDLPGGGAEDIAAVLSSTDAFFQAFVDAGIAPVVVMVISHVKASAVSVPATINLFGRIPQYVVLRNRAYGNKFPFFDGFEDGGVLRAQGPRKALESVNGTIADLPAISPETYARWDFASCTLADAARHMTSTGDILRINSWRKDFAAAIAHTPLALPR